MNRSGAAAATATCEGDPATDTSTPLTGIDYLDAWRVAVRPFPGSVPPFAGFCPIDSDDQVSSDGVVGAAMVTAVAAIDELGSIDPSGLDPDVLARMVEGVEQLRRMVDAAATGAACVVDVRAPFRSQGYLNARTFGSEALG